MRNIQFNSIDQFADILHLSEDGLTNIINYKKYKTFKIKKKAGGYREISAPSFKLKVLQKWILINILEKESISKSAMAFIKSVNGIKKNAIIHKDNKYLLEMDLKDFYPSITSYMVNKMYQNFGYSEIEANIFTKICTYKKKLPQGGITSPYISNLIFRTIDEKIEVHCKSQNICYSRYADDLTFSCNDLKQLIAIKSFITNYINHFTRFKINPLKTRIIYPSNKQTVTGITINNGKISVNKRIKQEIRMSIYNLFKSGCYDTKYSQQRIIGSISYVHSIEDEKDEYCYINNCIKYISDLMVKFDAKSDYGLLNILQNMKK